MIIVRRGNWQETTLAKKGIQLNTIYEKALVHKTTLDISTADIDRIKGANVMCKYITAARGLIVAWDKNLTKYDDQLLEGNVLQMMNDFPAVPMLDVPPLAVYAGIWHFIENRRAVWIKHDNFTDGIGEDMTILGPEQNFNTDTYKPALSAKVGEAVIHIKTDSADIDVHNLYAAIAGQPFTLITSFKGAKYDYKRILATPGQAENVTLKVQGVYQNETVGMFSDIVNVAYKG